mgnify:CR=1 FL=1
MSAMQKQSAADDKLRAALELYMEKQLSRLPKDGEWEPYTFSPAFERKMDRLIRIQRLPFSAMINTVGKRVAVVFVAVCLALTTTVFGVKALREPVVRFFIEVYEEFSRIIFQKDDSDVSAMERIEQYFTPQYLPDGFAPVSEERYDNMALYQYCDSDDRDISFMQTLPDANMIMDTEGITTENVTVNGADAVYYRNKGYDNLIWSDGTYIFSLSIPSALGKSELLRIAESVK